MSKNNLLLQLPFEFDIKKYSSANQLNARDWFYQLHARSWALGDVKEGKTFPIYLEEIKTHGILPYPLEAKEANNLPSLFSNIKRKEITSVEFITRSEAYKFSEILLLDENESELNKKYGYRKISISDSLAFALGAAPDEYNSFKNEPFDFFIRESKLQREHPYYPYTSGGDYAHLKIDLLNSDRQLIADFKTFLKNARTELGIYKGRRLEKGLKKIKEGKFSKAVFQNWVSHKILPYIDLTILCEFYKHSLTAESILVVLQENHWARSVIDDQLKPLAACLMDSKVISLLLHYAYKSSTHC